MANIDNSVRLSDVIVHYHTSIVFDHSHLVYKQLYTEYVVFVQSNTPGQIRKCIVYALNELEAHMTLHELGFKIVNYNPD